MGRHLGGGHRHGGRPLVALRRSSSSSPKSSTSTPWPTTTPTWPPNSGGHVPAALVRPPVHLLRAHCPVHGVAQRARQVRHPHVRPDRQQPGGDRRPALVPHPGPPPGPGHDRPHHAALVLLGVGTTLGVVVQAGLLAPSMVRARLHIRFLGDRTRPCAPSPAWRGGPSGGCWPTRWRWWSSWPWPTGSPPGRRLLVHLRLHLLPAPLRHRGRLGDDRGHAVAGRPLGPA